MGDLLLDIDEPLRRPVGCELAQPYFLAFVALAHDQGTGIKLGEQIAFGVEQQGRRLQLDAAKVVARDLQRTAGALDRQGLALLKRERAAWQGGKGAYPAPLGGRGR